MMCGIGIRSGQGGDAGYTGRAGRVRCAATQKAFGTDAKAGLAYGAAPANQLVPSGSQGQGPAGGHVHRRIEDAMRNPGTPQGSPHIPDSIRSVSGGTS
ncbi:hypothetical protein DID88_009092 [Monilinia fructigena]|uniref:Uncharacterized protein n=1 Tax=Monilinia fructigena TaxID=38457 RepID=A0A395IF81_9HELO|nr:hypothetical protein DID88_009092 [Monilinia fructigena]